MKVHPFAAGIVVLVAQQAFCATYVVPTDRDLTLRATTIVTGVVDTSTSEGQDFSTVITVRVDEAIKGPLAAGDELRLVEKGGTVGDTGLHVPGSPRYRPGERVLVFATDESGHYETLFMQLGRFEFEKSAAGEDLLVRSTTAEPIFGWGPDGAPHREPLRRAKEFLAYLRGIARGESRDVDYLADPSRAGLVQTPPSSVDASSAPSEYLIEGLDGSRWKVFPGQVTFVRGGGGSQAGVSNGGIAGIQAGIAAWNNDSGSNVNYAYGGTSSTTAGLCSGCYDAINSVQFNDPRNEIAGSYSCGTGGVLAYGGAWFASQKHLYRGESLYTSVEADVVVQNGIECTMTDSKFNQLMMHELGHTLGFRHSDEDGGDSACPSGRDCTSAAVMAAYLSTNYGANAQAWDTRAVRAIYGPDAATIPAAPTNLTAEVTGSTTARLRFKDNASNEVDFVFYYSTGGAAFKSFGTPAAANSSVYNVTNLTPGVVYSFRLTARNSAGESAPSNVVTVNTQAGGTCVENTTTACLLNGRFRVTVRFRNGFDNLPADFDALRKPVTGFANPNFETEFFYFNSPDNIEMVIKMLDQGNVNAQGQPTIAVLTGSATPLRLEVLVFDTKTGASRTYTSEFASQTGATDFTAFVK